MFYNNFLRSEIFISNYFSLKASIEYPAPVDLQTAKKLKDIDFEITKIPSLGKRD